MLWSELNQCFDRIGLVWQSKNWTGEWKAERDRHYDSPCDQHRRLLESPLRNDHRANLDPVEPCDLRELMIVVVVVGQNDVFGSVT